MRHAPWEQAAEFRIGLAPIDEAAWFEGGEDDPATRKDAMLAAHPEAVWAARPGSEAAQADALALVETAVGAASPGEEPPLYRAARLVADDLCLMERCEGEWRLTALSLSAGTYFTASEVVGRSLAELHHPVTGFGGRLLPRVERIFAGLRDGLILERRNWTVSGSGELFAPSAEPIRAGLDDIDPARAGEALHFRVERQTVRRLPRTGAVLFTIRVWLQPLGRLADDPARLARFARAWDAAHPDFASYKRFDLYDPLVRGFLRPRLTQTVIPESATALVWDPGTREQPSEPGTSVFMGPGSPLRCGRDDS